jgi:DNA-binding NtrC family response regulator
VDLILLDLRLPDGDGLEVLKEAKILNDETMVVIMTGFGEVETAVEAMKMGAYDFLIKPLDLNHLSLLVKRAVSHQALRQEVKFLRSRERDRSYLGDIIGESRQMRQIKHLIEKASQTPRTSILIRGETGTGKELVANAIHYQSDRSHGPFIKINCSALPEHLVEAELFGHEKGAFTDAKAQKKGLLELAHRGSVFLDEISEMKPSLQSKLLRVIEDRTLRRVGGTSDLSIDVRVMAATNQDLEKSVSQGSFREDLYYRLRVFEIELPPLRERKEDILLLASAFVLHYNQEFKKVISGFSPLTERMLSEYRWPGNVRELKNAIERAMILADGDQILPEHLSFLTSARDRAASYPSDTSSSGLTLEEVERRYLRDFMKGFSGSKAEAARRLGVTRTTLRKKLRTYDLDS